MALLITMLYLSRTRFLHEMALPTMLTKDQGYTAQAYPESLIGLQGTSQTPLRPAGKVLIGKGRYDAKTAGTYVASGEKIIVIDIEGTSLTVQHI